MMERISAKGFTAPEEFPDAGLAPEMTWLAIKDLVVDHSYQRPIRGRGIRNIKAIAADFRWSRFSPVICSPLPKGLFAIVDGQHRTTAALILGYDKVPCMVIKADSAEQAAAFKAINATTTRMSRQAIHAASVIAGEEGALALEEIARCASVTILRYPLAAGLQTNGGQTMAVGCLDRCLRQYGRDTLITALQCVTETENNVPGLLVAPVIRALCNLLSRYTAWRDAGSKLFEAFDKIDLQSIFDNVREGGRPKGTSEAEAIANALRAELSTLLGKAAA